MEQPTYIEQSIAHFGLDVIEIQTVEESYSSTVNILLLANGEKRVLKIPFNRQKLLREIQILKILQGNLPVPAVEDYWIADNDIAGALLLSWLPGQPVAGTITSELSYKLGALLGELHTHRLEAFGEVTQAGIAWCVKRNKIEDPFFTENLEKLRQLLGE